MVQAPAPAVLTTDLRASVVCISVLALIFLFLYVLFSLPLGVRN